MPVVINEVVAEVDSSPEVDSRSEGLAGETLLPVAEQELADRLLLMAERRARLAVD
jgi:hypothetical protein